MSQQQALPFIEVGYLQELRFYFLIKTFKLFSIILRQDIFTYHTKVSYKYYIEL